MGGRHELISYWAGGACRVSWQPIPFFVVSLFVVRPDVVVRAGVGGGGKFLGFLFLPLSIGQRETAPTFDPQLDLGWVDVQSEGFFYGGFRPQRPLVSFWIQRATFNITKQKNNIQHCDHI